MKHRTIPSKPWWRVPLLLFMCLLAGSSPMRADTYHFEGNNRHAVLNNPTLEKPYMHFVAMYFDKTEDALKNYHGFFTTLAKPSGAPDSAPNGPALFINGKYACSPIDELFAGDNRHSAAWGACSNDSWVDKKYTVKIDGITYTIRFYNPYHDGDSKRCMVNILIFPDKLQPGMTTTVKIAGWWKIMWKQDPAKEESYTWSFKAPPTSGIKSPTATMSEYGKIKINGDLLSGYSSTIVGSYDGATTAGLPWTDNLESSRTWGANQGSFEQIIDFPERARTNGAYYNTATKYIEYIIQRKDYSPEGFNTMDPKVNVNFYEWVKTDVPGYIRAKANPSANVSDMWKKLVKLTWESEGNNTGGTWSIYRYKTSEGASTRELLFDKIEHSTTTKEVTAPTYDDNYTYEISFIPTNGVQRSELTRSVSCTMQRQWEVKIDSVTVYQESRIKVKWSHNAIVDAADKNYTLTLERSEDKNSWIQVKEAQITNSNTVSGEHIDDYDLHSNHTYYYRIRISVMDYEYKTQIVGTKLGGSKILEFTATRGTYSSMVKLQWNVKQVGENITNFIVQRRPLGSNDERAWADIHNTSGTASGYSYDDVTALPGSFNEYKVVVWTQDGDTRSIDDEKTTDGFSLTTGSISGNITYGTGTAVEGAKVVLKQQNADGDITSGMRSVRLSGAGSGFSCNTTKEDIQKLFEKDFSIQMYLNPISAAMATDGLHYIVLDVPEVFHIALHYEASTDRYKLGAWINGRGTCNLYIPANQWSHVTMVHKHESGTTTFYVPVADSLQSAQVWSGRPIVWSNSALKAANIGLGNYGSLTDNAENIYNGYLDEFRFFTKALTEKEILRNYNHPLAGNEGDLAIYYPFDEGLSTQNLAYDFSKTNGISNGRHATTKVSAAGSVYIPSEDQLSLMAYTDVDGYYEVRGVPFSGEGTSYSIIPTLGIHEFSPSKRSRFVSMSTLNHSGVDFDDVSSFPVSGKIYYSGTDYPVEDVNFYIDGVMCSKDGVPLVTNADGEFTISVPIGDHAITVQKSGHTFVNNGRYPADPNNTGEKLTFDREIKGLEFRDTTLVNFTGRVVGGSIEGNKAVGFRLSGNNIGKAELVLTPQRDYRLNVVKNIENETTFSLNNNPNAVAVASATNKIQSTAYRNGGATKPDCQKIIIQTDPATGEFSAMLPPLEYKMQAIKLVKTGKELAPASTLDLTRVNVSLSDTLYNDDGSVAELYEYNTLLKQTYHAPASFTVTQKGRDDGSFGIDSYKLVDEVGELVIDDIYSVDGETVNYKYGAPLFIKSNPYEFLIKGFEEYTNVDNGFSTTVPLKGNIVTINNALSAVQSVYVEDGTVEGRQVVAGEVVELKENQLQLDDNGEAVYKWIAGLPNIAEPYTRTIAINYDIDGRTYDWSGSGMTGIILGDLPTGNNFVTSGPDKPLMILRDPPGTGSSAEWSTGSSTTTSTLRGDTFSESFGLNFTHKFGLCTQTIVGTPGAGDITVADSKDDLTVGASMESEGENSTTRSFTTSITKTITTSDAPEFVGDQGDVYIGASTNLIFGKARNVGFQRVSSSNEAELGLEDILTTNIGFNTMFQYTRYYIENTLIPNYKLMRSNLLTTVADTASFVNNTDHVVYVTPLSADDEQFGEKGTYKAIAPQVIPAGTVFEDSIVKINNNIENWENIIMMNERAKVRAFELREVKDSVNYVNYSFDGGTSVSYSVETDSTTTHSWEWTVAAGIVAENSFGFEIKGVGFECTIEDETKGGRHEADETETSNTSSFAFTLAEEGDDALSVDVYEYDAYGPIFRTRGGQTSAPYEGEVRTTYYVDSISGEHPVIMEATMQIEVPQIDVDIPVMNDVPTGAAADYTLRLSNASEIGADVAYKLFMLDETNENGAQLSMDGKVLTEGRFIKVPGNGTITKTLQLRQTNTSILDYEDIGIVFASESQPEEIADTVFISAHFVPSSSAVSLALSNTLINTQTGSDLVLTFSNFDRNYRGLKAFRLQYKKQGSADWTLLREYVLNEKDKTPSNEMLPATGASVSYTLPMGAFTDGNYRFRCVSASTYGSDEICRYSDEIALVKDMMRPRPIGMPEPADGVLDIGDELSVTFNEAFLGGELTKEANFKVTGVLNGAEVVHETALSMQGAETTAQTDATIRLSDKDFTFDAWINVSGEGTILSHGADNGMMTVGVDANDKLVVAIGGEAYVSENSLPTGKWAFLTLNYQHTDGGGNLTASAASDETTVTLFSGLAVAAYDGNGPLAVGRSLKGAIHELLLWDEARTVTTSVMNSFKTKSPSTRHLIGYWKMNEGEGKTIRDYARNRHMTMADETWYMNNENKAVSLSNSYLQIATADSPYAADDDFAVELWMRAENQSGAAQILQAGEVGLWLDEQGQLQLTGKGAYLETAEPNSQFSIPNSQLTDNAWHHIALNVLRQGAAAVYVDGERKLSTNVSNVGSIATDNILVGARRTTFSVQTSDYTYDRYLNGQVDEIRIWDATLNAEQLLANRKIRLTGNEDGLLYYYPFEKKKLDQYSQVVTVGTAEDLVGNGQEAQLFSASSGTAVTEGIAYTDEAPALRTKPTETNVNFNFTASDNKIVIQLDEDPAAVEGCTLNFTVRDVCDANGNYSVPATWSAFVNQNELVWADDALSIELPVKTAASKTATIVNKSGTQQMWTLSGLPTWLQADSEYGTTNPRAESQVTFTVTEATPIGKYEVTVYLKGNNGIETPLTVSVKVTGKTPLWTVNAADYEETMNLIGSLYILDVPSQDSDDMVAAFINDECRGVAQPEYSQRYDRYFVTIDIYANASEADAPVEFKAYDASTGIIYPVVKAILNPQSSVTFEANSLLGRYPTPVRLEATDEVEQNIALAKGWNWTSLGVKPEVFTVEKVFAKANGKVEFLKSNTQVAEFDGEDWLSEITAMNNREMYAVQTNEAMPLNVTGHRVNPADEPITVNNGWSWVAYNPLTVMSLADALADMQPQDDEIIKGQRGVAYYDNYEWSGSLRQLSPGQGYKIFGRQARTFTYPATTAAPARANSPFSILNSQCSMFSPVDYHNYPANMVVIAQVVYGSEPVAGAEVGIFVGDECREAAVTDDRGMIYVTVPGNEPTPLHFIIAVNGQWLMVNDQSITYETDAVCGTPRAPFVIDLGNATAISHLTLDAEHSTIFDLQGRRVNSQMVKSSNGQMVKSSNRQMKGVYIINGQKMVK